MQCVDTCARYMWKEMLFNEEQHAVGYLGTDFNCYSGLCWHKNWFADLNRYASVSQYNN